MKDIVLTNTEASDFYDCRRKWYVGVYLRRGKPDELHFNTPLTIGSMYHEALAAYYGDHQDPVRFAKDIYAKQFEDLAQDFNELTTPKLLDDLDKESQLVITMLEGYMEWLEEEAPDEDLEVLGAEDEVKVPLVPGIELQGKIDAPARWKHSPEILLQLEHKTTGSLNDIPKTAQINSQFLTYDLMAYLRAKFLGIGQRTDGVIVNMARKVKRTVRAKPPFYARHEVRHNETELRNHFHHLVGIGREIQRTYERLDAGENPHVVCPPHMTKDCTWKCPFAGPCLSGMFDDGSDIEGFMEVMYVERDPLERYKVKEDKNVEVN
jgi:hypothetical protein